MAGDLGDARAGEKANRRSGEWGGNATGQGTVATSGQGPTVSVIVVLFNSAPFVQRCLTSLLAHCPAGTEVLVVDNGSTDEGPALVLQMASRLPDPPPVRLRLLRSPKNRGYAGGINLGLSEARGDYVAGLNVDTEVTAGWLEALLDGLEQPGVGAVTPMILLDEDRAKVNALGGAIHVTGLSFCAGLGREASSVSPEPFSVPGISGAAFMMPSALLRSLGGAPERCFMGNDDVVLSWQVRLQGLDIRCVPRSVVYHAYQLSLDPDKVRILERNRLRMLLETLEADTLLRLLPWLATGELAIVAYCALKGPSFLQAKGQAWGELWRARGEVWQARAKRQAGKRVPDEVLLQALEQRVQWRQLLYLLFHRRGRQATRRG